METTILQAIGKRCQGARNAAGYSDITKWSKYLKESGIGPNSTSTLERIEGGHRAPGADYLLFLSRESGKPVDWILLGDTPESERVQARIYRRIRDSILVAEGISSGGITRALSTGDGVTDGVDSLQGGGNGGGREARDG